MEAYRQQPYFRFTKRERTGIVVILILMALFFLLPYFMLFVDQPPAEDENQHKSFFMLADSIRQITGVAEEPVDSSYRENYPEEKSTVTSEPARLFYFDPNELDSSGWRTLGVSAKTIRTIERYRKAGGRFRRAEDIEKIWGMPSSLAGQLKPYVRIRAEKITVDQSFSGEGQRRTFAKQWQPSILDINRADSADWEALPGIGPSLARRIVLFREKLGGFYAVDQVGETFGLPDSVFRTIRPRLRCGPTELKRISINRSGFEEMKSHPYIRFRLARAIDQYRQQHGPFQTVEDLRKIMMLSDSMFLKLRPYLRADEPG